MAGINFNPMATTTAAGSFKITSEGYIQGTALADPATRYALSTGLLGSAETLPMWGGIAITESIPTVGADQLGPTITRATAVANVTGFSTSNQAHAWLSWPQSDVPVAQPGMTVPFFRLGSGQRLVVACEPGLASLGASAVNTQVSWDFYNQRLEAYNASTATVSLTSITSSYANGIYTFVVVAAAATNVAAVGDQINISGVTGTGATLVNGNQTVSAFTSNTSFSFQIAAASGAIATGALSGTLVANQSVGALPVKVLSVSPNSQFVSYNGTAGTASWATGYAAVILL